MAIETPKYKVIKKDGKIEVRKYQTYINAQVEVEASSYNSAGNMAFSSLADYIFGNNISATKIAMTVPVSSTKIPTSEKIAMTAPVATSKIEGNKYRVTFTMPSKYSMNSLPKPVNEDVKLVEVKNHDVLVIKFSGYTSDAKVESKINELKNWAKDKGLHIKKEGTVSRYDPPWMPGLFRRNEISFEIIG
jgi:effector-binding domain-containing protein